MKYFTPILLLLLILTIDSACQSYTVMTFNLRYNNPSDGIQQWNNRKEFTLDIIKDHQSDIIGIQEGLLDQVQFLDQNLSGYQREGIGRSDGIDKGEFAAIYFKSNRFKKVEGGTFWLSKTPNKPTMGWDAAVIRICTWVKLQDISTGKKILFLNTHFDHIGEIARYESALLIVRKANELSKDGYSVIITGDFNSTIDSKQIKEILLTYDDSRSISEALPEGTEGTFHDFGRLNEPLQRIDFIFLKKGEWHVLNYITDIRKKGEIFSSDHYPVIAKIKAL